MVLQTRKCNIVVHLHNDIKSIQMFLKFWKTLFLALWSVIHKIEASENTVKVSFLST